MYFYFENLLNSHHFMELVTVVCRVDAAISKNIKSVEEAVEYIEFLNHVLSQYS